jgi:glutamine synthetase
VLKRQLDHARRLGFSTMNAGMEAEFFMFKVGPDGEATTVTHDVGAYFDLAPVDLGEDARRAVVDVLEQMGFEVKRRTTKLRTASTRSISDMPTRSDRGQYRDVQVCRPQVAQQFGCSRRSCRSRCTGRTEAECTRTSRCSAERKNAFWDKGAKWELSQTALHYIGGLLEHARGFCAITNPLVNSYKRLVPGFEAPVNVAWSMRNRTPMIRIPDRRGLGTRCELRIPDPSAKPISRACSAACCRTRWNREKAGRARAGEYEHLGDVAS